MLAPVVRGRKGEHGKGAGVRPPKRLCPGAGGREPRTTSREEIKLEKNKKHTIEIVVDRLVINEEVHSRLADSPGNRPCPHRRAGQVDVPAGRPCIFSQSYACPEHGVSIEELTPRMFSFNNPFGACPKCTGLGTFMKVDPDLVIPNKELSIRRGRHQGQRLVLCRGRHGRDVL